MDSTLPMPFFIATLSFFFFLQSAAAAAAATENIDLSPIFSPILKNVCDGVECGKGKCKSSPNSTFMFVCECDHGWNQFHFGDEFRFPPCIIPNCSVNISCTEASTPPPAALPPASRHSIFDPCAWSYCGGGTCVNSSVFSYKCECKTGYTNLLNVTGLPCYSECSLGADCVNLGIGLTNTSSTSPSSSSSSSDSSQAANQASRLSGYLPWSISLSTLLMTMPWI